MDFRNAIINTSYCWGTDEVETFIKLCIKFNVMYEMDEKKSSPAVIFKNVVDNLHKLGYPRKLPFQAQIKLKQLMLQYYDALNVDDNLGDVASITNFQYFDSMHEMVKSRSTNFVTLTTNNTAAATATSSTNDNDDNDHDTSLENKTKFVALKDHNYTNLDNLSLDENLRNLVDQSISDIEFVNVLDGTNVFPEYEKLDVCSDDDNQQITERPDIPSQPQPQQNTSIKSTQHNLRPLKLQQIQMCSKKYKIRDTYNTIRKHRKRAHKHARLVSQLLSKLHTMHANAQKEFFAKYKILLQKQYEFEMELQERDERRNQLFLKELNQVFESYNSSSNHDSNIDQQQQQSKDFIYYENLQKKYQPLAEQQPIVRPSIIIPTITFEQQERLFNIDDIQPSSLIRFKDFIKQTKDIQNSLQQHFVEHEKLLLDQQQIWDKRLDSESARQHNLFLLKLKKLTENN